MKASRLISTLLLASSVAVVQLAAQQTKADQKPIEEVKAKAETGDAKSQMELGRRYDKGAGVAKDHAEAAKWYRKAAEQNYVDAQFNLGMCYEEADAGTEDWAEVYKWLSLAARQGHEGAKKFMTVLESKLMTPEQIAQGQKRAREFKPR
jgi:TPR repeat protein